MAILRRGVFDFFPLQFSRAPCGIGLTSPRFLFDCIAVSALLNSIALVMIGFLSAMRKPTTEWF
jgi:hypothetical protein